MKTILLIPTKNESWILNYTLPIFCNLVDNIIASDQNSNDNTLEILNSNKKIKIISNNRNYHSNEVRWDLLEEARKQFGPKNLILNLDADEFIPSLQFIKHKEKFLSYNPGTIFQAPWIQLWGSINKYRSDKGVWNPKKNVKPFMFVDDGKMGYVSEVILNDHTSRVPTVNILKTKKIKIPIIHLQFVNWERAYIKQVWYMCKELINGKNFEDINKKYHNSISENGLKVSKVKKYWVHDLPNDMNVQNIEIEKTWFYLEIKQMFDEKSPDFFSKLNIWDNQFIIKIKLG